MARHPSDELADARESSGITGLDGDFIARAASHLDGQRTRMAALEEAMSVLLDRTRSMHRGLLVAVVTLGIAVGTLFSILHLML